MRALILRLEAPLMAFGGVVVDNRGPTARFPGRSLLTGLLANALGWDQGDFAAHARLQSRLRFAARLDRCGGVTTDYQTVDLGQPHLREPGWTTRGVPEGRRGGSAATGTHIRLRQHLQDASVVVALALDPPPGPLPGPPPGKTDEAPTLDDLAAALEAPARPLFLGRKPCLPAAPLLVGVREGDSLRAILEAVDPAEGSDGPDREALWPLEEGDMGSSRVVTLTDDRDWATQMHTGQRMMYEGRLPVPPGRPASPTGEARP